MLHLFNKITICYVKKLNQSYFDHFVFAILILSNLIRFCILIFQHLLHLVLSFFRDVFHFTNKNCINKEMIKCLK
jgi:hypothetical protein